MFVVSVILVVVSLLQAELPVRGTQPGAAHGCNFIKMTFYHKSYKRLCMRKKSIREKKTES